MQIQKENFEASKSNKINNIVETIKDEHIKKCLEFILSKNIEQYPKPNGLNLLNE